MHGNLNYASGVSPFGRPFLGPLMSLATRHGRKEVVSIPPVVKMCLRVWLKLLVANRGISFAFILKLPPSAEDVFVDASTEWGIGGCCGTAYFAYSWPRLTIFDVEVIARRELLACIVALACFQDMIKGRIVTLYSDNANVVGWLKKGRSSNHRGMRLLAMWETMKYELKCKTSAKWIPVPRITQQMLCPGDGYLRG